MTIEARVPLFDLVTRIAETVDLASPLLANHHIQVAYIAFSLAKALELSEEERNTLFMAGALHDIGAFSVKRLAQWYPNAVQVHTPVHASWLNQVEIYFSIVQRKVLTPSDFHDLRAVEETLLKFQTRYEQQAKPFEWKFSRDDLDRLLRKLAQSEDARSEVVTPAA